MRRLAAEFKRLQRLSGGEVPGELNVNLRKYSDKRPKELHVKYGVGFSVGFKHVLIGKIAFVEEVLVPWGSSQ